MMSKRISILVIAALIAVPAVTGQSSGSNSEMSIEEAYLQEAMEMMIIRENSRASSREQKLIALEYIGSALERGNTNEEIRQTLEYLSLEGTHNQTRERGRLMNDYPEVRREAVRHLGTVGTPEAKRALIRICDTEREPMVLQEALKSLGHIATDNDEDSITAIIWVANRFNNTTAPDNLIALAAVDSLDRIAARNNGLNNAYALQVIVRIAEGAYAMPVKERARQLLVDLRRYIAQGRSQSQ